MDIKRYFRTMKNHAFKFINPGNDYRQRYFCNRKEYKSLLIELLIATADRLNSLGVNVKITVGDDVKQQRTTKEAA